jgi:hypothetical protein
MGYVSTIGTCFACGRVFGFNPHRVPSIPIDRETGRPDAGGDRMPICRDCADKANEARRASGLPLWDVSDEAYAPIDEHEL